MQLPLHRITKRQGIPSMVFPGAFFTALFSIVNFMKERRFSLMHLFKETRDGSVSAGFRRDPAETLLVELVVNAAVGAENISRLPTLTDQRADLFFQFFL